MNIKILARQETTKAINRGELVRQPCEVCGELKVDAHHDDYSKPLQIRWLCKSHHNQLHGAEKRLKKDSAQKMDKTLNRDIRAFISKNGPAVFKKRVKGAGLSGRIADHIVRDRYDHRLHPDTEWRIRKAIE